MRPFNRDPAHQRERMIKAYDPRFKPLPVLQEGICDSPLVCLQVNAAWASHIAGVLGRLTWADAWLGSDEEIHQAIQSVEELIDKMSCLCDYTAEYFNWFQQAQIYQQTLINGYNGSLLNIDGDAPNVTFDSGENDTTDDAIHRANALCRGCALYVDTICEIALADLTGVVDFVQLITSILPFVGPGGVVIGLIIQVASEVVQAAGAAPFRDLEARENVACCMYDALVGLENNQDNLIHSVDDCYTTLGTNEFWIAETIRGGYGNPQGNWLLFNKVLAEAFRYSKAGLLAGCPCVPCDYTVTFDAESYSYTMTKGTVAAVGESGTQGAKEQQTDADTQEVQIDIPLVCDVTAVSFRYNYSTNRGDNLLTRRVQLLDSGGLVLAAVSGDANMGAKNVWATHNASINYPGAAKLRVYLGYSKAPNAIGHIYIDNIHFTG
jgi:hypothetical protein